MKSAIDNFTDIISAFFIWKLSYVLYMYTASSFFICSRMLCKHCSGVFPWISFPFTCAKLLFAQRPQNDKQLLMITATSGNSVSIICSTSSCISRLALHTSTMTMPIVYHVPFRCICTLFVTYVVKKCNVTAHMPVTIRIVGDYNVSNEQCRCIIFVRKKGISIVFFS